MRPLRILAGVVFIVMGLIAAIEGEFGENVWLVAAAAVAVAGVLGIISAIRA